MNVGLKIISPRSANLAGPAHLVCTLPYTGTNVLISFPFSQTSRFYFKLGFHFCKEAYKYIIVNVIFVDSIRIICKE